MGRPWRRPADGSPKSSIPTPEATPTRCGGSTPRPTGCWSCSRRRLVPRLLPCRTTDAGSAVEFHAPAGSPAPPGAAHRSGLRVDHDVASFTIEALPVEAFEALLVVTSWIGEVIVDEPPYQLDVMLTDPLRCWCRLDLVPDAGASTVAVTIVGLPDEPLPDIDDVRDLWVALPQPARPDPTAPERGRGDTPGSSPATSPGGRQAARRRARGRAHRDGVRAGGRRRPADAVPAVFEVKGRPAGHPLIVHIASADTVADWAVDIPRPPATLAATCWPGPLTLLLARGRAGSRCRHGGSPDRGHPGPGPSGRPRAVRRRRRGCGRAVGQPLRAGQPHDRPARRRRPRGAPRPGARRGPRRGPSPVGVESTIVDCTVTHRRSSDRAASRPRDGGVIGAVAAAAGRRGRPGCWSRTTRRAPRSARRRPPEPTTISAGADCGRPSAGDAGRSRRPGRLRPPLYADLRGADGRGPPTSWRCCRPPSGLGYAVRDRLEKAAAPLAP